MAMNPPPDHDELQQHKISQMVSKLVQQLEKFRMQRDTYKEELERVKLERR